jgi:hypothetical protein
MMIDRQALTLVRQRLAWNPAVLLLGSAGGDLLHQRSESLASRVDTMELASIAAWE